MKALLAVCLLLLLCPHCPLPSLAHTDAQPGLPWSMGQPCLQTPLLTNIRGMSTYYITSTTNQQGERAPELAGLQLSVEKVTESKSCFPDVREMGCLNRKTGFWYSPYGTKITESGDVCISDLNLHGSTLTAHVPVGQCHSRNPKGLVLHIEGQEVWGLCVPNNVPLSMMHIT